MIHLDRYGGRLYTAPHGEAYLEYGANWIHGGSDENVLFELAGQKALIGDQPQLEDRTHGLFYTSLGQPIDSQLGQKCYQMFFEAEMNAARLYRFDHLMKRQLATKSLLVFLEEEWERLAQQQFKDASVQVRQHADAVFRSMLLYFRSHVGNDLSLVPAILHGTFENVAGEDVLMPAGMSAFVDQFYVRLPKNCCFFDTTVTDIFWSLDADPCTQSSSKQPKDDKLHDYPMKIITDSGLEWRAKHVIATLPLGVLKRSHDKIFHPPLPPLKVFHKLFLFPFESIIQSRKSIKINRLKQHNSSTFLSFTQQIESHYFVLRGTTYSNENLISFGLLEMFLKIKNTECDEIQLSGFDTISGWSQIGASYRIIRIW